MPRAIWNGSISFGLVNIPVRLFNATSPKDVRFHQFDRETGRRVRHRRVVPVFEGEDVFAAGAPPSREPDRVADAPEVPAETAPAVREVTRDEATYAPAWAPPPAQPRAVDYEDVVKGFEVDRGRYVTVTPEELRELQPERTHSIDIVEFVDLADIDPVYFDRSYYVAPYREPVAEKAYALLLRAMNRAGKVAIGRFVLRTKEYLAAIRPMDDVVVLETMFYADEVRELKEIPGLPLSVDVSDGELAMAEQLISILETKWDPSRHQDEYRNRVMQLIESKMAGEHIVEPEPVSEPSPEVPDLMAALRASVEAVRERSEPKKRKRKSG